MARDEVHWLLRHQFLHWYDPNKPLKLTKGMSKEDWLDKSLPEMLFLIEELRSILIKFNNHNTNGKKLKLISDRKKVLPSHSTLLYRIFSWCRF